MSYQSSQSHPSQQGGSGLLHDDIHVDDISTGHDLGNSIDKVVGRIRSLPAPILLLGVATTLVIVYQGMMIASSPASPVLIPSSSPSSSSLPVTTTSPAIGELPVMNTAVKVKPPAVPTTDLKLEWSQNALSGSREVLSSIFTAIQQLVDNFNTGSSSYADITADRNAPLGDADQKALNFAVKGLRVNIRRLRCILRGADVVLGRPIPQLLAEWVWFFRILGPASDLGVLIEQWDRHLNALQTGGIDASGLAAARKQITVDLRYQFIRLREAIDSERFKTLVSAFGNLLETKTGGCKHFIDDCPDAFDPVGEFAAGLVWTSYKRVVSHGRRLDNSSTPSELHDLRKKSKELRYLVENFNSLWSEEGYLLMNACKTLQDRLGELQDCVVQQNYLLHLTGQPLPSYEDPSEVADFLPITLTVSSEVDAVQALLNILHQQQVKYRAEFPQYYQEFDSSHIRRQVKETFGEAALGYW